MSTFRNFAVIGVGNLGGDIINELLALKTAGKISSVVVISRSDVSVARHEWVSQGAKFVVVDYDNPSTFESAFTNVDVVISTVSGAAVAKQGDLATAAKAASVKLFVPSEFGDPTDKATQGKMFLQKRALHDKLKELDLPYSLFFTGLWIDFIFTPAFGWDPANGQVHIGGEGNTPITFTAREDILSFVMYALTALSASELQWSIFRLEGERATYNDIVGRYEAKTGKKLQVRYTPRSVLRENVERNPDDLGSLLPLVWDEGEAVVGEPNAHLLFPSWKPKKIFDILGE